MYPGEIQIEQMANESLVVSNLRPLTLADAIVMPEKRILLMILGLKELHDVKQLMVSGRSNPQSPEIRVLFDQPVGYGLMRLTCSKSSDDLLIVAVAPNGLQNDSVPVAFFSKALVHRIILRRYLFDFTVAGLKKSVVSAKNLDFSYKIILVRFGVGLVDTFQFTLRTSATDLRSLPVTLYRQSTQCKFQMSQLKLFGLTTHKKKARIGLGGSHVALTLCLACLHGLHAKRDTVPAALRFRAFPLSSLLPLLPDPPPDSPGVPPLASPLALVPSPGDLAENEAEESSR